MSLLSIQSKIELVKIRDTDDMTVSARDVGQIFSQLKCGKPGGSNDLCAEHFKFTHDILHALLSMCFTLFLSRTETIIVQIVKNKCEKLSDSNNCPIALAMIMSKLFK